MVGSDVIENLYGIVLGIVLIFLVFWFGGLVFFVFLGVFVEM